LLSCALPGERLPKYSIDLRITGKLTGNPRHNLFVSLWAAFHRVFWEMSLIVRDSEGLNVGSERFGLDRISKKAESGLAVGVPIDCDAVAFEISLNSPAMEGW
jgi:hypothetical protein